MGNHGVHDLVGWSLFLQEMAAGSKNIIVVKRQDSSSMLDGGGQSEQDVVVLKDYFSVGIWPNYGVEYYGFWKIVAHSFDQMCSKPRTSATGQTV